MGEHTLPISAVVLTYNEEDNLGACLASIKGWTAERFVVDSCSTDNTCAIAEKQGATVVQHGFRSHTEQWSWALEHLPLGQPWVLGLDADQHVTPELRDELVSLFEPHSVKLDQIDGIYLNRRTVFRGTWIRHGGFYPKYLLKLFRRDKVVLSSFDLLDHHFYVPGKTLQSRNDIIEENQKERDVLWFIGKHEQYAVRSAREESLRRSNPAAWSVTGNLFGSPDERTVWLKQRWYHLPLYIRPFLLFLYRYVVRRGFLDGKDGFVFHLVQSFWFRTLVDMNLDEMLREDRETAIVEHVL
jgi:glycosyltransferase involved in cell wall biosynthesis